LPNRDVTIAVADKSVPNERVTSSSLHNWPSTGGTAAKAVDEYGGIKIAAAARQHGTLMDEVPLGLSSAAAARTLRHGHFVQDRERFLGFSRLEVSGQLPRQRHYRNHGDTALGNSLNSRLLRAVAHSAAGVNHDEHPIAHVCGR
jgi:hypothetical protein